MLFMIAATVFDAMTESVVILGGWLTVITGRKTKVESPLPHTHPICNTALRSYVPLRPCDGLSGASVKWQSFALRFLTRHLSSSSSRCRQFRNIHCALLSLFFSPLKNHEYFAIVFGRHKLGRSCLPSTAVWTECERGAEEPLFCTLVSIARMKGTLSHPCTS